MSVDALCSGRGAPARSGARRPRKQANCGMAAGADPVSRRAVEAAGQPDAGAGDDARCATWRVARAPASLPPRRVLVAASAPRGVAAVEDRGPGADRRCGEGWRVMLPSSPSLRSIDRSFLLRAASPCRVPLPGCRVVECSDVVASISGARIASSACVRITQDACARELSNGFASDMHDRSHEARDARRRRASDRRRDDAKGAARMRREGRAGGCRRGVRHAFSRARRSEPRTAGRRRCSATAGGSAGCPPPARTHARPSR